VDEIARDATLARMASELLGVEAVRLYQTVRIRVCMSCVHTCVHTFVHTYVLVHV
jgi:hypothetical protein